MEGQNRCRYFKLTYDEGLKTDVNAATYLLAVDIYAAMADVVEW